mmetsp:Transcript_33214/g.67944  ORF Transcript_33214/g.67944 Transcript_33214/m.67944 type:complete len:1449 (+) Transcript_33214:144-4490(+)
MNTAARFFVGLNLGVNACWAFVPPASMEIKTYHTLTDSSRKPFGSSFEKFQLEVSRSTLKSSSLAKKKLFGPSQLFAAVLDGTSSAVNEDDRSDSVNVVLVTGFESFNRDLYEQAGAIVPVECKLNLQVFADSDIRTTNEGINENFANAVKNADAFIGSLIFDYDDVVAISSMLPHVRGPRLIFESATELMAFNRVGTFNMQSSGDGPSGPPPAVKSILKKFSSGKEEDKISGYLKMLKMGPDLLKFVPGEKASDLRTWLEAYRYWNQGGMNNVKAMLQLITQKWLLENENGDLEKVSSLELPDLEITPDVGLLHPLLSNYAANPKSYVSWRLSSECKELAKQQKFKLAPNDAPRVAVLLYRKHVITNQRYIQDLIRYFELEGIVPIPVFINGVEAHTIVRDWLTSQREIDGVSKGVISRDSTYKPNEATSVDAIVSTIGFPLVGGPAGSMEAGRNVDVASQLLKSMDVPYVVASPLLLQSIPMWKSNGVLGLQSVVLYSLPELDGAIDTVVLGGLVGDKIALVPERVRKLCSRLKGWIDIRKTPPSERKVSIMIYGFPPNVGAVGTAALLDVPNSLENILKRLHREGYDVGDFATNQDACGESLVAALTIQCENSVIAAGADRMQCAIEQRMERARNGDKTVPETLARPGGGLGRATVRGVDMSFDELEKILGKFMTKKVRRAWSEKERGPGINAKGEMVVSGLQVGNVWITVQPLLGVEGDPMRLLFERDLTPHPQYCAAYEWMRLPQERGGVGTQAVIHLGMHGTVEWLPGQPLGNDRQSWSDELLGGLPNIYIYAANNPSESILAKRRGYGTIVSYNVPPYGRAGLYLELANLKDLVNEYRTVESANGRSDLKEAIFATCEKCGINSDVAVPFNLSELSTISIDVFDEWIANISNYLVELEERLFSSGLHTIGRETSDEELSSYLNAYFSNKLSEEEIKNAITAWHQKEKTNHSHSFLSWIQDFAHNFMGDVIDSKLDAADNSLLQEATNIIELLARSSSEEMDSVVNALDGGYVLPAPGGDLLRDGTSVLPTGRNIHALDPYRMPSAGAWARGERAANEIIRQHRESNNGAFPETCAVTLWGLDTIKTRGESIAIVLSLVGARPVKEGTGRTVCFELIPLNELGRPRIDVLASLSGIFRDSFANVVDLLDDMFERAAFADESPDMNYIKKHTMDLETSGTERPAARLFSNPPGDYGSMVNEVVGSGDWDNSDSLGEIWKGRNSYSYGRKEGGGGVRSGTWRPEVLDKLLSTTDRVVQEIDSIEYGLTDIQEYYANTGALKKAAENRKEMDNTGRKKKVAISVIEAFGGTSDSAEVPVKDVEDVLRMEYRSKLLNPKWRDAMIEQGSGGAYEVSQRMTAMVGWAATSKVDNFVFDQAAERYALDEEVSKKLQKSNPEAFKNVVRRLLEANGRGMWETDEDTLEKLRNLYSDADDLVEQIASSFN